MPPRTLIGAGLGAGAGALAGGALGAASGKDSESRKRRAFLGAVGGGATGSLAGGLTHGVLRTRALRGVVHPQLQEAMKDPPIARVFGEVPPKARPALLKLFQGVEGFLGKQTVKGIRSRDPFAAAKNPTELKKIYHGLARAAHPDRGGNPEQFKAVKELYDLHKDWRFPTKAASAIFWEAFVDEITKSAAKSPTTIKVPKPGTNLKGMERYTANPGKTPITEPGKANASKASTSGVGFTTAVGRTATSANPTPAPPPVT